MTALHETPTDKPILANIDQFKKWFKAQAFYTNLVFVHGDQLFDFETSENAFRVLAVQTAWCVWQEQQQKIDDKSFVISELIEIKNKQLKELREQSIEISNQKDHVDVLKKALSTIYMNAESDYCDSCKYAESEAEALGCGLEKVLKVRGRL